MFSDNLKKRQDQSYMVAVVKCGGNYDLCDQKLHNEVFFNWISMKVVGRWNHAHQER